jgi:hypothetical protein
MLTIHTTPDVEDTLSDSSPRRWTYHAEAGWQTGGWYGEAKQAARILDLPYTSEDDGPVITSRHVMALGVRILRAQQRDERHEQTCNAGAECAVCNAAFLA